MSGSLENRSSLRKLEFPACSQEALNRMLSTFSIGAPGVKGGLLSPKETELVLEIVDEFIFFTKSSKSKRLNQVQELQLMQVVVDFFQANWPPSASSASPLAENGNYFAFPEVLVLCNIFNHIFMDPPSSSSKDEEEKAASRMKSLVKLTSVAMGLKSRPVLHCLGVWLHKQGSNSEKALSVCESLLQEFILLVDEPLEALKNLPVVAPLFAAHLLVSMTEIYTLKVTCKDLQKNYSSTIIAAPSKTSNFPPKTVLHVVNSWMTGSECQDRLLPTMVPCLISASCLGQSNTNPLLGLARWTVLYPLVASRLGLPKEDVAFYSQLHVGILECLSDVARHRQLIRNDVVSAKRLGQLVSKVGEEISLLQKEWAASENVIEESLDRLGQFVSCVMAINLVTGERDEIFKNLKGLKTKNQMIGILMDTYYK